MERRDVTFHIAPDADHSLKHEPRTVAELGAHQGAETGEEADARTVDEDVLRTVTTWVAERSPAR